MMRKRMPVAACQTWGWISSTDGYGSTRATEPKGIRLTADEVKKAGTAIGLVGNGHAGIRVTRLANPSNPRRHFNAARLRDDSLASAT